jgi:cytochrome P450 family 6
MIVALIAILLLAVVFFVRRQYSHWDHVGVKSIKPKIPIGNLQAVVNKERSFGTAIYDLYKQTTEPFIGIYLFFRPALLVRDRELVKTILTKDFQHFHDRGVYCEPKSDPMSGNLFALTGEPWKNLRSSLTPAFTSGKLKGMFSQIHEVGNELVKLMTPMAQKGEAIDIRDLAGRYVVDCLASIAFGQEGISTIENPDHEFKTNGRRLNDNTNFLQVLRGAAVFVCPK